MKVRGENDYKIIQVPVGTKNSYSTKDEVNDIIRKKIEKGNRLTVNLNGKTVYSFTDKGDIDVAKALPTLAKLYEKDGGKSNGK